MEEGWEGRGEWEGREKGSHEEVAIDTEVVRHKNKRHCAVAEGLGAPDIRGIQRRWGPDIQIVGGRHVVRCLHVGIGMSGIGCKHCSTGSDIQVDWTVMQ